MKQYYSLISTVVFLLLGVTIKAQSLTVLAEYDAQIGYHDGYPSTSSTNYGFAEYSNAFTIEAYNNPSGVNNARSLIYFDLSTLPGNANITGAYLDLYAHGPAGALNGHEGPMNNGLIERVLQPWTEASVTWDNQPSVSSANSVLLPVSNNALEDYLSIDVTGIVNDMIVNGNNGFRLKQNIEAITNVLMFCSVQHPDSTKHPRLTINYSIEDVTCFEAPIVQDAAIGYHDGWNTANTNYSSATQFAGYTIPASGNPGVNVNRSLIEFDLTSIPTGMTIVSAELDLYAHGPAGTLSGHTGSQNSGLLQRVTGLWLDNSVTWNTQPSVTNINEVLLPPSSNALEDYIDIDVTSLVTDMYFSNNFGIMLSQEVEQPTNVLLFCSSDHSDTTKYPSLEVCYQHETANIINLNDVFEFTIYPNPVANELYFRFDSMVSPEVSVTNGIGKIVYETKFSDIDWAQINTTGWSAGVYFINIKIEEHSYLKKIVKW